MDSDSEEEGVEPENELENIIKNTTKKSSGGLGVVSNATKGKLKSCMHT